MTKNFFHSTVFKIVALMFSVSFLAIVSMFSSVFISDGAQSDALAVNVAGSLRMQSYRLASKAQALDKSAQELDEFYQLIDDFDHDLTTGVLVNQQALSDTGELAKQQTLVNNHWLSSVKPMLIAVYTESSPDTRQLNQTIQTFVDEINLLVERYQNHAESNIATIRLIQSLALFCTLILIALAMIIVNRHIEQPLSKLTQVARQIGRGDFTVRADDSGKDELSVLAHTFNTMSDSIYRSKSQLEDQVKRKTLKLSRSNESLDLLFKVSRKLNEIDPTSVDFKPILTKLAKVTGIKDIDLCIMTAQGSGPYEHLMTANKDLPDKCVKHQCGDCTDHNDLFPASTAQMRYQLTLGGENYGVLVVQPEDNMLLDDWQHQLFESLAEQVANGLRMKHQNEQNRRMALMNERTIIARELHDSLAQALSYLKIQVTRLQRLHKKENVQEQIEEVVDELKTGLGAAYSELRELLTTFRLKLDGQGIKAALEQTISQLKTRSDDFVFELGYAVENIPFSPQEEIHLLQIAREAIQNAFYHSKGDKISISLHSTAQSEVILTIADNGVGIPEDPNKLNHYGLAIMQERSRNLKGELSVKRNSDSGTTVAFCFIPEYAIQMALKT
ncbi:ATP-binding protein [uncultured Paraglaciecola sp.]|uniref:ATP-binding protein n=1 Tax=uncultured Paraglaciecola sp. TaxID=1765024 RepID=UPI0025CBCC44|nr:ATP-binding protein [uncultured Paraglaciecola sp.]